MFVQYSCQIPLNRRQFGHWQYIVFNYFTPGPNPKYLIILISR